MPSNVALWPPFRGHRPPLCALRLAVPAPSHQLRLRYSVSSQLLIPLLPMPSNVALWPPFRGHRPPLRTPSVLVPPSHQLRCPRGCVKGYFSYKNRVLKPVWPVAKDTFLSLTDLLHSPSGLDDLVESMACHILGVEGMSG